jgi:hypothetical protein
MTMAEACVGITWFLLFAVSVSAAIELKPARSPAALAVGAAAIYAAIFPLNSFMPISGNIWRAFILFCFLTVSYLMVFGAVYKSVSLRMLLDLLHAPSHRLAKKELNRKYIEQESFEGRINVMLSQGLADRRDGKLLLTAKGRRVARVTHGLQRTFGIHKSG